MGTRSAFLSCLKFSFTPATCQLNLRLPTRSVPLTKSFWSRFWKRALQSGCLKNTGAVKRSGRKETVSKARQLGSDVQPRETSVLPETAPLKRCLSACLCGSRSSLILHRGGFVLPLKAHSPPPTPSAPWTRGRESKSFLPDKFRSGGPQTLKLWPFIYIVPQLVVTSLHQKIVFAATSSL